MLVCRGQDEDKVQILKSDMLIYIVRCLTDKVVKMLTYFGTECVYCL